MDIDEIFLKGELLCEVVCCLVVVKVECVYVWYLDECFSLFVLVFDMIVVCG